MEAATLALSPARDAGITYGTLRRPSFPRVRATPATTYHADAWSPSEEVAIPVNATDSSELGSTPLSVTSEVSHRLFELIRYSTEDDEPLPTQDSISGLWAFFDRCPTAKNPLLTSDSDGSLVATWRISTVSMLSIRFLDRTRIQFAWAREDKNGKVKREWGEDRCENFVSSFTYAKEFIGGGN